MKPTQNTLDVVETPASYATGLSAWAGRQKREAMRKTRELIGLVYFAGFTIPLQRIIRSGNFASL
jgi:hypothetical protein